MNEQRSGYDASASASAGAHLCLQEPQGSLRRSRRPQWRKSSGFYRIGRIIKQVLRNPASGETHRSFPNLRWRVTSLLLATSSVCHTALKRDGHRLVTQFYTKNEEGSGIYRPYTRVLELLEKSLIRPLSQLPSHTPTPQFSQTRHRRL
jgi:hypothetical protein